MCEHTKWEYSIDFSPSYSYGCETCGTQDETLYINRYCTDCKKQLGYLDVEEKTHLIVISAELDEIFRKQDEKEKIQREAEAKIAFQKQEAIRLFGTPNKKYGVKE